MGTIYGVIHAVGPDHLATLMALSTLLQPMEALSAGASWGLGHSAGMALIAALLFSLQGMVHNKHMVHTMEHYGNYVIGASMIICALYFICAERSFVERKEDGSYIARPCACHSSGDHSSGHSSGHSKVGKRGCKFKGMPDDPFLLAKDPSETDALLPPSERLVQAAGSASEVSPNDGYNSIKGGLLGVLQGLCCPMGAVSVSFLTTLPRASILCFLAFFVAVSCLGTALLALGWSQLTRAGIGATLSPHIVYRSSCAFTLLLGVLWMVANYFDVLGFLDYTEHIHVGQLHG